MPTVLGLDIGYSNLKFVVGNENGHVSDQRILPAGAGQMADLGVKLGIDGVSPDDVTSVLVDGELYAAGVPHSLFGSKSRQLHSDYPSSPAYRALFLTCLLQSKAKEIDVLVTGLPTSQALDTAYAAQLAEALTGEFPATKNRTVTVKKVRVMPQPVGAFMDLAMTYAQVEQLSKSRVMIVDPGFFSMDWAVIQEGRIDRDSSSTSKWAMSAVIDAVSARLVKEEGGTPGREALEAALRAGATKVLLYGEEFDFAGQLGQARQEVAREAMMQLRNAVRKNDRAVDFLVMTGGGAGLYEAAAQELFPKAKLLRSADPVIANAKGFFITAARTAATSRPAAAKVAS